MIWTLEWYFWSCGHSVAAPGCHLLLYSPVGAWLVIALTRRARKFMLLFVAFMNLSGFAKEGRTACPLVLSMRVLRPACAS